MNSKSFVRIFVIALIICLVAPFKIVAESTTPGDGRVCSTATVDEKAHERVMDKVVALRREAANLEHGADYLEGTASDLLYPQLGRGAQAYPARQKRAVEMRTLSDEKRKKASVLRARISALLYLEGRRMDRLIERAKRGERIR